MRRHSAVCPDGFALIQQTDKEQKMMSDDFNDEEDFNLEDTFGYGSVTLTLEDDTDVDCLILSIFEAGEHQYIALVPLDENGEPEDDAEILLYRFIQNGPDEEPDLENIEDDDEYDVAADVFAELMEDLDDDTFEIELD